MSGKRVVGIEARKTEDDHDGLPLRLRDRIEVIEDAADDVPRSFGCSLACSSFIAVSGTIEQHSFPSSVPPSVMRVLSLSNEICMRRRRDSWNSRHAGFSKVDKCMGFSFNYSRKIELINIGRQGALLTHLGANSHPRIL